MIPKAGGGGTATNGALVFRVVVDDFAQSYSLDGPEANAVRLHLEVMKAARDYKRRLREVNLRAHSRDEALAMMREHFPDYVHLGAWRA